MNELNKSEIRERLGNIDQIRDILFGSYLREYSNRLEQVEKNISVLQQEIRERTDEIKQVLRSEIQAAVDSFEKKFKSFNLKDEQEKFDLNQKIDTLNQRVGNNADEIKNSVFKELKIEVENFDKKLKTLTEKDNQEKVDLRQQINHLTKRITTNIKSLDESIDQQTSSLREELMSSRSKIQEDILSLRNQVFEELERRFNVLTESKMARDDLAELLFELGLRLKGTEFVPKLEEAANSEEPKNYNILPE